MKDKTVEGLKANLEAEKNAKAIYLSQRDRMARHLVAIAKKLADSKAPADIELARLFSHRTVQDALETIDIIYGPNGPPPAPYQMAQRRLLESDQKTLEDGHSDDM